MTRYILDAHGEPMECEDVFEWIEWTMRSERNHAHVVAQTVVLVRMCRRFVSTVFTGNMSNGPPFFETMIFGGLYDMYQQRYITREQARAGHLRAVSLAREGAPYNRQQEEQHL